MRYTNKKKGRYYLSFLFTNDDTPWTITPTTRIKINSPINTGIKAMAILSIK